MLLKLSPKKSSFVSGIRQGERCFITHPPTKSNMHQNKYFQFQKKLKKRTAASKGITMTSFTFTWLSLEFLLVVHMNLMQFTKSKDKITVFVMHTTRAYEVHTTFKNKSERKSLRDNSVYHFLFYICLFVVGNLF